MTKKAYLVDGSGYIFRAFYAVAPLSTKEGLPTNALFGFIRMLLKLLKQSDSEHVVVVFDSGRDTFRKELYPEYKANRAVCPPELEPQFPYFRQIVSALGIASFAHPGFEADDVIATLTERLAKAGVETVIVTADKDLMQLVDGGVTLWDTMRDRRVGRAEVREKFGVEPERVPEVLGLIGDTSDNVPGIKGVGEKTAAQLVEKYGNVEEILASIAAIREDSSIRNRAKIAEALELNAAQLRLSRRLVEVDRQVPCMVTLGASEQPISEVDDAALFDALRRGAPQAEQLSELMEKLEFHTLLKEILGASPVKRSVAHREQYRIILRADYEAWLRQFLQQRSYAIDLETTSLDPRTASIVGFAFCWENHQSFYVPVGHLVADGAKDTSQVSVGEVLETIAASLANPQITKIGQNLKYDFSVLLNHGIAVGGAVFDTMIAAYLLNPDRRSLDLGSLGKEFLGLSGLEYEDLVGELESFAQVPIADAGQYAAEDAHFAWLLAEKLRPLISENQLQEVFEQIEMPLLSVLVRMEHRGIKLDTDLLQSISVEYAATLERIRVELFALAGGEFNMNSPKQLSEILFDRLALPSKGLKKTKTGISTDSSVLEKLTEFHPLPAKILEYRQLFKLKSTYVDALPQEVSQVTRRLHTKFNQAGTATGRLSSSEPNLQNIPIQTAEGRRIRQAFVAENGNILISADYSQIELRLLAHLSGDENLIESFRSGKDIHEQTAREVLNLSPEAPVLPEDRRMGKTINFGVVYGMSGFRLGRDLGIPVGVANNYIESYFARYPKVRQYFAELERSAEKRGFVTTISGRRRMISGLDLEGRDQGFAARVAINAPIQGSAADLIKRAMINIDRRIGESGLDLRMLLQIHDELLFECPQGLQGVALDFIRAEMEQVMNLRVPLIVDIGCGRTWEEAHG